MCVNLIVADLTLIVAQTIDKVKAKWLTNCRTLRITHPAVKRGAD